MAKFIDGRKVWYSRGYLPHFDGKCEVQFVTFRLSDSLPQDVLNKRRIELKQDEITDAAFRKRVEHYLDQGYGACWLKHVAVATTVQETLQKWDDDKYRLISWVIMPNHVHILIELMGDSSLSNIMHSIKSYTAHESNKILGKKGAFWFVESFDRYIRHGKHYTNVIRYIENNPVKARLCKRPEDWVFSSAYGTGAT